MKRTTKGNKTFPKTRKQYHVVPASKGWSVKKSGARGVTKSFGRKSQAVAYGRRLARRHRARVVIHRSNGKIMEQHSYSEKGASHESELEVKPGFGGAKGLINIAPDFDEPLEEFDEYA